MKRGDVVRVALPRPQGTPGREQYGERPAIVLQHSAKANPATTIVIPLTSNQSASRFPGAITVDPTTQNGLDVRSVILVHQLRAIDTKRIRRTIGRLSEADMDAVSERVKQVLGL